MEPPDYEPKDVAVMSERSTFLSRRNLPRASHACQLCRLKKARCDQRQPCANCVKHSFKCIYTAKRGSGTTQNTGTPRAARHENSSMRGKSLLAPMGNSATRGTSNLNSINSPNPHRDHSVRPLKDRDPRCPGAKLYG
jgi:hypothetical protein